RAERADDGVLLDGDVAGQRGGVGQDAAVSDLAVVADVHVGHDEAAIPQAGDAAAARGPARDGDRLANGVIVAQLAARGLARVLQVLRRDADRGEGEDAVAAAEGEMAVEHDVGDELALLAEDDVRADGAERADAAGGGNLRAIGNDRAGMDAAHSAKAPAGAAAACSAGLRSVIAHMTVASQATLPSTVATPRILTALERQLRTVTSMRNWSPGTTGLRNLAASMLRKTISLLARSAAEYSVSSSAAPACAMASTMSTPGMMGKSGKWPAKCGSLMVTFFSATTRFLRSISMRRSMNRKG